MFSGCYTLMLYCDGEPDPWHRYSTSRDTGGSVEITGRTESECRREARRVGWRLDMYTGLALCPRCRKEGRTAVPETVTEPPAPPA